MPVSGSFSQATTLQGQPIFVRDMTITESAESRMPEIQFMVDADSNPPAIIADLVVGAIFNVQQVIDGTTYTNVGTVLSVSQDRLSNTEAYRVRVVGEEYQAQRIRFIDRWERTAASTIIQEAWSTYAPGFDLNIEVNNQIIQEVDSVYDSLYDLTENICRLTGWAWRIIGGEMSFFDPLQRVSPTITQPLDIEGNTLAVSQSLEGVYNIVRTQAYAYRTVWASKSVRPGQCVNALFVDPSWGRWELVNDPVLEEDNEITASFSNEGAIELSSGVTVTGNFTRTIRVKLVLRRLVWVERRNQASIDLYGILPAPALAGDGGQTIPAAIQQLDRVLKEKAFPIVEMSCFTTKAGFSPDSIATVDLFAPALNRQLYVREVTRTTNKTEVSVSVRLASPEDLGLVLTKRRPDPVVDMERRITRLEKRDMHPDSPGSTFADFVGPISAAPQLQDNWDWSGETSIVIAVDAADNWDWSEQTTVVPFEEIIVSTDIAMEGDSITASPDIQLDNMIASGDVSI